MTSFTSSIRTTDRFCPPCSSVSILQSICALFSVQLFHAAVCVCVCVFSVPLTCRTAPCFRSACTGVALTAQYIVAVYGSGHLRLFSRQSGQVRAEATAHARWITGLDLAAESGLVVTVAEDASVKVWKVSDGHQPVRGRGGGGWRRIDTAGCWFTGRVWSVRDDLYLKFIFRQA